MGARPFIALTETALSEALASRGAHDDRRQARQLRKDAMATIADLDLQGIEQRVHHRSLRSWARL
jgi:hypothetical protein